jgi:coenzyme F420-0:L-glutamate ligase / coenzyme F420-1:gamma-L-glutamate ligase
MHTFSRDQLAFLEAQRVGRLATADRAGQPHVVPVCYACDGISLFVALDAKPKRVDARQLKRVRNILENPAVALVVDRYQEDWSQLAFLLIQGTAALLEPGAGEHTRVIALLRARYPQYAAMPIEQNPAIAIRPISVVGWFGSAGGHELAG